MKWRERERLARFVNIDCGRNTRPVPFVGPVLDPELNVRTVEKMLNWRQNFNILENLRDQKVLKIGQQLLTIMTFLSRDVYCAVSIFASL